MLNYVLIGLGGALGSVLRAWLGTAMAAVTGQSFPWGTILINIVGSFVIGFFGTLTATDGRFAVPFDVRAFVMVGICGGFTTFSSFSLQTLELARDGRAGQALGNVALSVALCLASVAAGYALATSIRTSPLAAIAGAAPGSLASSTVVAVYRPESVRPLLDVTGRLMETGGGRTTVLAVDGPVLARLQPTEEVMTTARREQLSGGRKEWVGAMRVLLDEWVARERKNGHPSRWIEIRGDGAMAIAEHGRTAQLLILEHDPADRQARIRVHVALAHARRPVLLVPPAHEGGIGTVVAVAWQNNNSAACAVRSARPLLDAAGRVVVLTIDPDRQRRALPPMFDTLDAVRVEEAPDGDDLGGQLLRMAHAAGADLLVMGSHSRGRLRFFNDTATTESVIAHADLPVLLQHRDA